MKSIKEQLSEEFRDKLLKTCYAFEDAKDNSPEKIENWEKERDNISAFLSQAIDRTREETIREALFNYAKFLNDNCKEGDTIELTIKSYLKSLNKLKK
jgi:hypothetical protein